MCCAMSLVCPSMATHRTCQFWARSEPVKMPKTIETPAKCGVRAVIRFLYSEPATRNDVLRYCPSSWQCSAAHCSCNKEAPNFFSIGSVWSPTIIRPDLAPCDFHLFPRMKRCLGGHILAQWVVDQRRELAENTGGWLLRRWYWKVGTTPRKMSTSERRLCKEVAGRCG